MANTVTITKILGGPTLFVYHVFIKSDGSAGELEKQVLIDPVDLGLSSDERFVVEEIVYGFTGFNAIVEFDAGLVESKMIWVLPEGTFSHDFRPFSGLKDRSGLDGTGKLTLTTVGLDYTGDQGSMLIKVKR